MTGVHTIPVVQVLEDLWSGALRINTSLDHKLLNRRSNIFRSGGDMHLYFPIKKNDFKPSVLLSLGLMRRPNL